MSIFLYLDKKYPASSTCRKLWSDNLPWSVFSCWFETQFHSMSVIWSITKLFKLKTGLASQLTKSNLKPSTIIWATLNIQPSGQRESPQYIKNVPIKTHRSFRFCDRGCYNRRNDQTGQPFRLSGLRSNLADHILWHLGISGRVQHLLFAKR